MKIENENSLVLLIWNMGSSEKKKFKIRKCSLSKDLFLIRPIHVGFILLAVYY